MDTSRHAVAKPEPLHDADPDTGTADERDRYAAATAAPPRWAHFVGGLIGFTLVGLVGLVGLAIVSLVCVGLTLLAGRLAQWTDVSALGLLISLVGMLFVAAILYVGAKISSAITTAGKRVEDSVERTGDGVIRELESSVAELASAIDDMPVVRLHTDRSPTKAARSGSEAATAHQKPRRQRGGST